MQAVPTNTLDVPWSAVVLWWVLAIGSIAGAVWLVRTILRAVRALEKRSTVAEETLLLTVRVAQQEREIAALRSAVARLEASTRSSQ